MKQELDEKTKKICDLAVQTLSFARNSLFINLRFMEIALGNFKYAYDFSTTLCTTGDIMIFNPTFVLRRYREASETLTRDYLHVVLHCLFNHLFGEFVINREIWDLACDIAVESVITELGLPITRAPRETRQHRIVSDLQSEIGLLTAEKLYEYYCNAGLSEKEIADLREIFKADDHTIWYTRIQEVNVEEIGDESNSNTSSDSQRGESGETDEDEAQGSGKNGKGKSQSNDGEDGKDGSQGNNGKRDFKRDNLVGRWKDIAERVQEDLKTFSKARGDKAGNLVQNLKEVTREKYDYTSFLKKFATMHEAMKINDDEFDYVYYTYGLKLYDKMPLVEPLEYKDVKQIKEFVIAIDTSGSVQGALVQSFLQKTYNILKNEESFFKKFNLHIIQCDANLQHDEKITSQREFDDYIANMKLYGFGGTDFRPVFSYVNELIQNKEFVNLKGLIYFTDGYGVFPSRKPDYDVAFVFVNEFGNVPAIPPWAIKLVLKPGDIK